MEAICDGCGRYREMDGMLVMPNDDLVEPECVVFWETIHGSC